MGGRKVREDIAQLCVNYYESLPQLSNCGVVKVDATSETSDISKPVIAVLPSHIKKNQEETKILLNTLLKKIQTEKFSSFEDIQTKDPEMLRPFISHGVTSQGILVTLCKLAYSEQRKGFIYLGIGNYNLIPPETSKILKFYSQNLEKFLSDDSYRSEVFQCKNFDTVSGSCMVPEEYYLLGVSQGITVFEPEENIASKKDHENRLSQNGPGSCTRRSHEEYYMLNMRDFIDISNIYDQHVGPHFVTKQTKSASHPVSPVVNKPTKSVVPKKSSRTDHLSGIEPTRKAISTLSTSEKHLILGELVSELKISPGTDTIPKNKVMSIIDKMTSSPDVTMEDVFTVIGYGAFISLQ